MADGDIKLKPGRIGSFEITIDGALKFSKLEAGRFPNDAEVDALV